MSEFVKVFESTYLYEVEIVKSKLASENIESYIRNEYVNNVVVMPISQRYILVVQHQDAEKAQSIISELSL